MSKASYILLHQKRKKEIQMNLITAASYTVIIIIGVVGIAHGIINL